MESTYKVVEIMAHLSDACIVRIGDKIVHPKDIKDSIDRMASSGYSLLIVRYENDGTRDVAQEVVAAKDRAFKDMQDIVQLSDTFVDKYIKENGKVTIKAVVDGIVIMEP